MLLPSESKTILRQIKAFKQRKILVVVPYYKEEIRAQKLKDLLIRRAGIPCDVLLVDDRIKKQGWIGIHNELVKTQDYDWYVYCPDDYFPGRLFLKIALDTVLAHGKRLVGFNDGKWHGANATAGMIHSSLIPEMYGNYDIFYNKYKHHGADPDLTEKAILMDEYVYAPTALLIEIDYEKDFVKKTNPDDFALFLKRREKGFPKYKDEQEL